MLTHKCTGIPQINLHVANNKSPCTTNSEHLIPEHTTKWNDSVAMTVSEGKENGWAAGRPQPAHSNTFKIKHGPRHGEEIHRNTEKYGCNDQKKTKGKVQGWESRD